jgi:hypothetical protein
MRAKRQQPATQSDGFHPELQALLVVKGKIPEAAHSSPRCRDRATVRLSLRPELRPRAYDEASSVILFAFCAVLYRVKECRFEVKLERENWNAFVHQRCISANGDSLILGRKSKRQPVEHIV